jgi:hypothetical protein
MSDAFLSMKIDGYSEYFAKMVGKCIYRIFREFLKTVVKNYRATAVFLGV